MEPVKVESRRGRYHIIHKCTVCHVLKRNKSVPEDNVDSLIALSKPKL